MLMVVDIWLRNQIVQEAVSVHQSSRHACGSVLNGSNTATPSGSKCRILRVRIVNP
jgi:hypothetical protein